MGPDLEEQPPNGVPATYEEARTGIPEYVKVWEEPGFEPIVPLSSLKPCSQPSKMPELMFEPQRPGQPPHNFGFVYEQDGTNRGKERKEIRSIDLFAGSGGFHQGVMQEPGFKGIAAVEMWDKAVATFKLNCKDPDTKVYETKVESFLEEFGPTPTEFEKAHGKIDVCFASPPCQSFSGSNRDVDHNGEKDLYRKGLSLKFFDANQTSGALIGVFENVEGMWRRPNIYFLKKIVLDHLQAGWQVRVGLHRAHRFGDPQARPRLLIFVAKKFVEMPKLIETHGPGKHPFMTVGNAFKALDQTLEEIKKNPDSSKPIPNLEGAKLAKVDKEEEILKADKPAGTIRAGGRAWHPTKNRPITVREAATLQSYPYYFEFLGSLTDQYRQVGNAVPGKLAKAIARAVKESLRFIYDEENETAIDENKEEEQAPKVVEEEAASKEVPTSLVDGDTVMEESSDDKIESKN
jgi:DNA (cytosine-5)-methyltransferase 1